MTTHPLLGVAGVLLGAMIATCTGRLMSVGLLTSEVHCILESTKRRGSTLRSTHRMMFIGPFSVYLGGLLGPRRVLLACAWIFTAVSFLIPFCHSLAAISDSFLLPSCIRRCVACLLVVASCLRCQPSIDKSLPFPWRPNEKHVP